jgi:hypothetical protein
MYEIRDVCRRREDGHKVTLQRKDDSRCYVWQAIDPANAMLAAMAGNHPQDGHVHGSIETRKESFLTRLHDLG